MGSRRGAVSNFLAAAIVPMDGFHVEVKYTETFKLYDALAQALADKKPGEDALVFHRRNGKDWVVVMDAEAFMLLMNKYVFN
jgi:hypothetical protein